MARMVSGRGMVSVWGSAGTADDRRVAQLRDHAARRLCAVGTHRVGRAEVNVVAREGVGARLVRWPLYTHRR